MKSYETEANFRPQFIEEVETYILIDFSDENVPPQESFTLGEQLLDFEDNVFSIKMLKNEQEDDDSFASVSIDAVNVVSVSVDLDKAREKGDGNYTISFVVREFASVTGIIQSEKFYSLQLEVRGVNTLPQ